MPYGRLSPDDVDWLLDSWNSRAPRWAGLMIGDPFIVSDPLTAEIIGNAYRRAPFVLHRVDHLLTNLSPLSWAVPPMTRVAGIASFNTAFNGRVCHYTPRSPEPLDFPIGGTYTCPSLALSIGIDS